VQVPRFLISGRGRVRLRGVRSFKLTLAAVLSYVAAIPVSSNARPVVAPLTALLVVQLTLYDTLRSGLRRLASVVAGVLVAVGFSAVVGDMTWWSLGIVVGAALVVGRVLRLGDHILEVPISAMLVLAVGGSDVAATGRIVESLVGAVVGVVVGALFAPPLYVRPASEAVQSLAGEEADVLRRVAAEVEGEYTRDQAEAWLREARGLGQDILRADRALDRAQSSLRLNPRAAGRGRYTGESLRSGLGALERAAVSLRSLCRSLTDRLDREHAEPVYGPDVRTALSGVLREVAVVVEEFGDVVGSEVSSPASGPDRQDADLREALTRAWQCRGVLVELLRRDERRSSDAWELDGALTAHIDRLLRDLDSDVRAELRQTWPVGPALPRPVQAARARLPRRGPH
jgi:uncharacterized membrane protein YccC